MKFSVAQAFTPGNKKAISFKAPFMGFNSNCFFTQA
jgi:hypothetical protein